MEQQQENQNFENTNPEVNTPQEQTPSQGEKPMGPIIGIIIIVIILIAGGLYFWGQKISVDDSVTPEDIATQTDTSLDALKTQSTSDKVVDIQADLNTTDLGSLDAELQQINAELSF